MVSENATKLPECLTNTDVERVWAALFRIVEKPNVTIRRPIRCDGFGNTFASSICGHAIDEKKLDALIDVLGQDAADQLINVVFLVQDSNNHRHNRLHLVPVRSDRE